MPAGSPEIRRPFAQKRLFPKKWLNTKKNPREAELGGGLLNYGLSSAGYLPLHFQNVNECCLGCAVLLACRELCLDQCAPTYSVNARH